MIPRIDRRLCNQSVTLKIPVGELDKYGKQKTKEIEVENVLVQPQTIYSGDSNNRKIMANAIVFLFAKISNPLPRLDRSIDKTANKALELASQHQSEEGNDEKSK